jgi:hypothetical protein
MGDENSNSGLAAEFDDPATSVWGRRISVVAILMVISKLTLLASLPAVNFSLYRYNRLVLTLRRVIPTTFELADKI